MNTKSGGRPDRLIKTDAVVLHSFKYGEADSILTLLGRRTGKISAIAKGSRKPKSRMRGTIQLFNHGNYLLYKGRSLYTVSQCETKESFKSIRQDLLKFAYASYVSEITREALPEEEENQSVFMLLLFIMHMISTYEEGIAARLFDLKLLKIIGYEPEFLNCLSCGFSNYGVQASFSFKEGGVLCPSCARGGLHEYQVKKGTLAALNYLKNIDMRKVGRLRIEDKNFLEMETMLTKYWEYILEKKIKSLSFINGYKDCN